MLTRAFKYFSPFLLYYGAMISFLTHGFLVYLPLLYSWMLVPLLELFISPDERSLSAAEEELIKKNKWYDIMLYLIVPCQYLALGLFLYSIAYQHQPWT